MTSVLEFAPEAELIVVDDASDDGTAELVEREFPDCRLFRSEENLGFGATCNRGASVAESDVLLFLNQDAVLRSAVDHVTRRFHGEPDLGIAGGLVRSEDGRISHSQGRTPTMWRLIAHWWLYPARVLAPHRFGGLLVSDAAAYRAAHDVDWVSGSCLFVRRGVFRELEGFDDDYIMYVEDIDLCTRARRAGQRVAFDPATEIVHAERGGARRSTGFGAFAMTHTVAGHALHLERHSGRAAAACAMSAVLPCFLALGCAGVAFGWVSGNERASSNGTAFLAAARQALRSLVRITRGRAVRAGELRRATSAPS